MKLTFEEAAAKFSPGTHHVVLWVLLKDRGVKAQKRRSEKSWKDLFKLLATPPKKDMGRTFPRSPQGL